MSQRFIALLILTFFPSSLFAAITGGAHSRIVVAPPQSFTGNNLPLGQSILEVQPGATVSGSFIFNAGTLIKDNTVQRLTGTFNATENKVLLNGGSIDTDKGLLAAQVEASGSGNQVAGLARLSQPIVLTDSATTLACGIESTLSQNIVLNGGTTSCIHDLTFGGTAFFVGPGMVNSGIHQIETGKKVLSAATNLTFNDDVSLLLNNSLQLQSGAQWVVQNTFSLDGNAHTIDITGGVLQVESGATLFLHDGVLNGVAPTTLTLADDTSTLQLSDMFVDFDDSVTFTAGALMVTGETTLVLRSKKLLLEGTATMVVDGGILWYDSLNHDFYADNKDHLSLINGGMVRDVHEHVAADRLEIAEDATVTTNFMVDPHSPVIIGGSGAVTLNASGHSVEFAHVAATQLTVLSGVQATLTNIVLKDYSPANTSIGGSGATLTFGGGTRIELGKDELLNTTLPCSGNVVLDGKNYCLDFGATGAVTVAAGGTLTLKNITLRNVSGSKILGLANSSKIIFENVVLELSDQYSFSGGSFEVDKQLLVVGGQSFAYTTDQQSTIRAQSSLVLDSGTTFDYNPASGGTDRLVFAAGTSRLVLRDSILKVASTGALLTTGVILIDDTGTFNSLASDLTGALSLGDGTSSAANCTVRITPHSTLHISDGVVKVNDA